MSAARLLISAIHLQIPLLTASLLILTLNDRGHELTDAYMNDFEKGFEQLYGESCAPEAPRRHVEGYEMDEPIESPTKSIGDLARGWGRGPLDSEGTVIDFSDRPLLCMSHLGDEVVVGGSDHALYTLSVSKARKTRQLHSKAYGHAEWVSCVSHLTDGRSLNLILTLALTLTLILFLT